MPVRRYFHASPAVLAVGDALVPDRDGRVFLAAHRDTGHDWAHLLDAKHLYLVEPTGPVTSRPQKDALGGREWTAPGATVVGYVGQVREATEYCDGCLPARSVRRTGPAPSQDAARAH